MPLFYAPLRRQPQGGNRGRITTHERTAPSSFRYIAFPGQILVDIMTFMTYSTFTLSHSIIISHTGYVKEHKGGFSFFKYVPPDATIRYDLTHTI